jgi:hypothetical protein
MARVPLLGQGLAFAKALAKAMDKFGQGKGFIRLSKAL